MSKRRHRITSVPTPATPTPLPSSPPAADKLLFVLTPRVIPRVRAALGLATDARQTKGVLVYTYVIGSGSDAVDVEHILADVLEKYRPHDAHETTLEEMPSLPLLLGFFAGGVPRAPSPYDYLDEVPRAAFGTWTMAQIVNEPTCSVLGKGPFHTVYMGDFDPAVVAHELAGLNDAPDTNDAIVED